MAYFTASCDTAETNQKFAASLELDYPILSDPLKTTAKAYGVASALRPFPRRWTFVIGVDGKILHVEKQVQTATHGEQMANILAKLGLEQRAE